MNNLVLKQEIEKVTLLSLEVAEMLGKEHYELLKEIEGRKDGKNVGIIPALEKGNFPVSKYFIPSTYKSGNREYKCYEITKMGCHMLGNKLQGEKGILFTAKYVERFNEMEKQLANGQATKQLSAREKLELHYQFSEENAKRIDSLEQELEDTKNDFKEFQEDLPLIGAEPEELQKVVKRVGTNALGGHGSPAYKDKSLSAKVYKNVWKFVKDQFNVNTYKAIKRKHLSKAKEIAESYKAPFYLQEKIDMLNNQSQLNI
ncbi:Rha family transcriptional regulator [Clostridium perfringens]|uniref:Rha family transcriptional regulator n=1 Tax=Clostridium perfringens TaxID=1502 RepID=UPI00096A8159|nr:Rha family transcriptional regulator [Clostridium perfringens]